MLHKEEIRQWGNRYILSEKIGRGSYGTIYKVKDMQGPEGQESIKVLKEMSIESMTQDEIDKCAQEGKLLSKLNHPHIVQFFDSFCFLDNYCIITEFCEGGDLNKILVSSKQKGIHLEERKIICWFIQIIQALDYIHKRKVLHRDLKPSNIFLKYGFVKIGDFGISRILSFTMDMASTFLGTPYYMSPEVLKHDGYNTTSDIWSAGIILYEMCSLQHPFESQTLMGVMVQILNESCPKIPSLYSDNLQEIIEKIIIRDPVKRPSAQDVISFPYINRIIKDPWIDISKNLDLSETLVQKDIQEISNLMSESHNLKILDKTTLGDETIILTPKQKLELRKKQKADKEVEEKKKITLQIYNEEKEISMQLKQNSNNNSLPFTKVRYEKSLSESKEFNNSKISDLDEKQDLSKSVNMPIHFIGKPTSYNSHETNVYDDVFINDEKDIALSKNQNGLYNMKSNTLKYNDSSKCKIIAYQPTDHLSPGEFGMNYDSDFESDASSTNSDHCVPEEELINITTMEKFQDDSNTDPYGIVTKITKINAMKQKCLEKIDENTLNAALNYMDKNYDRKNYISGLRKICKSDDVAMIIDQIHFLKTPNSNIY